MQYRLDRYGNKISALGFGCMRFPQRLGLIDRAQTEKQILLAIEEGVNYFDTAYVYPGSENALGEILEKNGLREKIYIATKLPHYLIKSREGLEKMFQEQLKRLRTSYVDYYLMHMLSDLETWEKLKALGIEEWLSEKRRLGQIRQVGFSYHGNADMFIRLLDAADWDFCQIQYNYMDEHSQAGRKGLEYAGRKGVPVIIMEPLRGGRLVRNLPAKALEEFKASGKGETPAQWALKWLWNQKDVTCVLSGMNSEKMIEENIQAACASFVGCVSEEENAMLRRVVEAINEKMKVGCTGCGYCMPCPKMVDIPGSFSAYNRRYTDSKFWAMVDYTICTALRKNSTSASQCVGCGKCEQHCPQHLPIREHLKQVQKEMENPIYRAVKAGVKKLKVF